MKIQLLQLSVTDCETPAQRLGRVLELLEREEADLTLLPELWYRGFFQFNQYEQGACETAGLVTQLSAKAAALGRWIHTGSFVEKEDGRLFNTSWLLNSRGEAAARYRKIHLFGFDSQEKQLLTPGREAVSVFTPFGCLGLAACYDLRFPEQFRRMVDQGVCGFLISACWPAERLAHWRLFCQARAVENQAFLLACNCAGTHRGVRAAGHSLAVAPDGRILAEAGEEEEALTLTLDPEEPSRYRNAFSALADRVDF